MSKTVNFKSKPRNSAPPTEADAWVSRRPSQDPEDQATANKEAAPRVPMKRLTFDIPADLHTTMKVSCAQRGTRMAEEIRDILAQHYLK
jgi:hypothetical protein